MFRSVKSAVTVLACTATVIAGCAPMATEFPKTGARWEKPNGTTPLRFVDMGGIRDWRAEGSEAMLIQGQNGDWYRARFNVPCSGLQFRDTVAFVTDGMNQLDQYSSVIVDNQRCWFRSFDKVEAPAQVPPPEAP